MGIEHLIARIRRKVEILRMDAKQQGVSLGGHAKEILILLDIMEKEVEQNKRGE